MNQAWLLAQAFLAYWMGRSCAAIERLFVFAGLAQLQTAAWNASGREADGVQVQKILLLVPWREQYRNNAG